MPRTEEYGHLHTIRSLKRVEELGESVEPTEEFLVALSTFEHRSHSLLLLIGERVGLHPCRTSGKRIVEMPTQCHHTAAVILADNLLPPYLFAHSVKRHSVEVYRIAQFEMTEVESNDSGIVVAHALHVRATTVAYPSHSIYRVVLMTNEIAIG